MVRAAHTPIRTRAPEQACWPAPLCFGGGRRQPFRGGCRVREGLGTLNEEFTFAVTARTARDERLPYLCLQSTVHTKRELSTQSCLHRELSTESCLSRKRAVYTERAIHRERAVYTQRAPSTQRESCLHRENAIYTERAVCTQRECCLTQRELFTQKNNCLHRDRTIYTEHHLHREISTHREHHLHRESCLQRERHLHSCLHREDHLPAVSEGCQWFRLSGTTLYFFRVPP